ncbi:MAG: homogentisate 1,2-dioxygenase [Candidatus Thorarchaeota archaeon]
MPEKKFTTVFPLVRGKTSKQAHADLPKYNENTTFEEEHGRKGFFGKVSHLYHIHPPTGWINIDGPLKPELLDTNLLEPNGSNDVWSTPTVLMQNSDVKLKVSKRSGPMPYYFRNSEGDDLWFVHQGKGTIETTYGPLEFDQGDYIVIPRGTMYRVVPETKNNHFLVIESRSEIEIPDRGMLGPNALFDPAVIETPEPAPIINSDKKDWIVRVKRNDQYTDFTFPYNPIDVIGWKGDVTPWKLNIHDFRPIMSHRYHLPPSAHTTFLSSTGSFVICSFVPRPFETEESAIKVPFHHSNVDYDEIIFYHDGNFFSRDNISSGMITFHPCGFTHGPHPKALTKMFKQNKTMTDEYAVMLDTKNPMELTPEGRGVANPDYWKSWMS